MEKHLGSGRRALLAHVAGPTEDGWRIIDIWQEDENASSIPVRAAHSSGPASPPMRTASIAGKAAGFRSVTVEGAEMPF